MKKIFRINIYLSLLLFFKALISKKINKIELKIENILKKNSKKKYAIVTSQCRIGFLLVLLYFKKYNRKKEIIFSSYNLPEMINIAKNLGFKIIFADIEYNSGNLDLVKLKKTINKNTLAVVLTNMFNSYEHSNKLRKICLLKKVYLVEDNAIYFDNYKKKKNIKVYSGELGDFSLYSFNIMKNISALYGGAVLTNNKKFYDESIKINNSYKKFSNLYLMRQTFIFFILKVMSSKLLYNLFFFKIVSLIYKKNISFMMKLFYPSLRFKIQQFPKYYFSKISRLSKYLIYFQLLDKENRNKKFKERKKKNIYYYKKLKDLNNSNVKFFKIIDFNYQNFIDFPILVKNKKKLVNFLLSKGFEVRYHYYKNCKNIFEKGKKNQGNSQKFENEIICLPNHEKVNRKYIEDIINNIKIFYSV